MKRLIGNLLFAILVLLSCNDQPSETATSVYVQEEANPKMEFARLDEFLQKFDQTSQIFKKPASKLIKIEGKQGTILYIDPADLETESGQPIGKEVEIELKELSNRQQLLNSNAQTVSEGQLLISGGAFFVNVTSEGQNVKLKEGKSYSVSLPKLSDNEMSLFYGQRDSLNTMNWKQADQKFVINALSDTSGDYEAIIVSGTGSSRVTRKVIMSEEEYQKQLSESKVSEQYYNPVALKQFGWINCDRFYKQDEPKTNVQFAVSNNEEDVNYVLVSLILKDINSIMQSAYYLYNDNIEGDTFENVPVGLNVRFLAVSYQNEKIFATLTDELKLKDDHFEKILLKEMSEAEFDKLMKSIE